MCCEVSYHFAPASPKHCLEYRGWICTIYICTGKKNVLLLEGPWRDTLRELLPLFYLSFFFQSVGGIDNLEEFCLSPEKSKNPHVLLYIFYKSNPDHSPHIVFKLSYRHPVILGNLIWMVLSDLIPLACVSILSDCYS